MHIDKLCRWDARLELPAQQLPGDNNRALLLQVPTTGAAERRVGQEQGGAPSVHGAGQHRGQRSGERHERSTDSEWCCDGGRE